MKTDRELLELAARAAGLDAWWSEPFGFMLLRSDGNRKWSPIENDGDALRLSVKLGFMVDTADFGLATVYFNGKHLQDSCYRRAITRAAAQIQLDKEKQ